MYVTSNQVHFGDYHNRNAKDKAVCTWHLGMRLVDGWRSELIVQASFSFLLAPGFSFIKFRCFETSMLVLITLLRLFTLKTSNTNRVPRRGEPKKNHTSSNWK